MDILYQADVTEQPPAKVLEERRGMGRDVLPYAEELVIGVERSLPDIDALLSDHAEGWAVHRMAVLDRTLLRLACYELRAGLAPSIAINEAVELANELSTEDSGRFINGVLGRIAREAEEATALRTRAEPRSN